MISIACMDCGRPVEVIPIRIQGQECKALCNACMDADWQSTRAKMESQAADATWEKLCPTEYQDTVFSRLPLQDTSAKALRWQFGPMGLNLWGHTRTGKTRTVVLLMRREFEAKRRIVFWPPGGFAAAIDKAGYGRSRVVTRCVEADLVVFDDIGKTRLTPIQEGEFFAVLEQRISNQRPTIVTENYNGKLLTQKFGEKGVQIVERIKNHCTSIAFHYPTVV